MASPPADRMSGIDLSSIRKMFELAGKNAISFGIGEPDAQPPAHAVHAFEEALRTGRNKYCPSAGIPELREALAAQARERWAECRAFHVVVTVGSTNGLLSTMLGFLNPGDEVLVPDPGFVLYAPHARLAGAIAVRYPLRMERGFCPQPEDLEALVTRKTKAIVVNTPSNPTGGVLTERAADGIAEVARDHGLLVISDEAYDHFVYGVPHVSMLGRADNLVYLNTFSKTYAMTGWRLGWAVATRENADVLKRVNYHMVASPPTPTQYGALAALTGPQDFVKTMVATFRERRDLMVARLRELPGFKLHEPQGAFYAFPHLDRPEGDEAVAMDLLKRGVVTVPGGAFGPSGKGFLRFSYATSADKIARGMDIVAEFANGA
ncbi:MAG TPA: pyridoxal phosphate-dependent aminotransferase [Candidatus Thermoplasmatota archaeon]|nr:pyridoxal phosphate-dependent aminotransferase [Candidatus Thermoplasmatota archaeon]